MPRTIRFHLDENCPRTVAAGLRRRGIDVTTTPEAGLLEGSNEQQDAFAFAERRVIFTQDEDFLVSHASGRPTPESPTARKIREALAKQAILSFLEFDRFASGAGDQGIPDAPILFGWQWAD